MIIRYESQISRMLDNLGVEPMYEGPNADVRALQVEKLALQRALQAAEDRLEALTQQKIADDHAYNSLAEQLKQLEAERNALWDEREELIHERDKSL